MGLQDLIKKHGGKFDKKDWFTLKEPTLEDAKRIAAKGELEELGFRVPFDLRHYLDISPEGELVERQEIPQELQSLAEETREAYRRAVNAKDIREN